MHVGVKWPLRTMNYVFSDVSVFQGGKETQKSSYPFCRGWGGWVCVVPNAGVYAHIHHFPFLVVARSHARGRRNFLSGDLGLGLELTADLGTGQDLLTVLVELQLADDDVGGVDAERDGLAGGLVAGDTLDVDDVFETVDGGDLALAALVGATDDGDLVVLADGDAADL